MPPTTLNSEEPIILIVVKRLIYLLGHIYPSLDYGKHFKIRLYFVYPATEAPLGNKRSPCRFSSTLTQRPSKNSP